MKPEIKRYIYKTAISGFMLGLICYLFFGLTDTTGSKWGAHVFLWDVFSMCAAVMIVDRVKRQEIFAPKESHKE